MKRAIKIISLSLFFLSLKALGMEQPTNFTNIIISSDAVEATRIADGARIRVVRVPENNNYYGFEVSRQPEEVEGARPLPNYRRIERAEAQALFRALYGVPKG